MSRSKGWCFTLNNPTEDEVFLLDDRMDYLVYQLEQGESETPHYQGYIHFKQVKSLNQLKKLNVRTHWENAHGTAKQNQTYCTKVPRLDGPWEYGDMPIQGKRTDLNEYRDAIMAGKRKRDLVEDFFPQFAKYTHMYDVIHLSCIKPIRKQRSVTLLYGEPGTGKTSYVHDLWKDEIFFDSPPQTSGSLWFDGYDQHELCLIDDFAGASSHVTLTTLLRMLDDYPVKLQVKGSFVWFNPDIVFITTNIHPRNWYSYGDRETHYVALKRRINMVLEFRLHQDTITCDLDSFFKQAPFCPYSVYDAALEL